MMILSRIWYVILAILLAAAYYIVALAVGQYNRRNQGAMEETLKADSQVVSWAMQVDARRRLDVLLLAAVDPNIAKAIRGANGKDAVPPGSKEDGAKALRAFNEKLPADYKNDILFIADREGRLVAQVGYDAVNGSPEFELGGYPAVFDALHGFLRDDTWVWGGKIARVVTRPVEDEVGQPPLGAVIGLRWIDSSFAKEIGKRTRTNIAFFALGQRVASAASTDGFEESSLEALGSDLKAVGEDKGFKENGRTDVRPLGDDKGGVLFVRMPGDAWELGGGFAVARPKVAINSPTGFLAGADDTDKKNVKLWLVGVIFGVAALLGFLFSFLEHSMPMREMKAQAEKLKHGQIDTFNLPRFRGGYRPIATDINAGIQRVIEKGGGTGRKPADLESILGPVPAQPNMSAFSFPLPDGSAPPQQVPQVPANFGAAPSSPGTGTNARFPGAPPPPANARPQPPAPSAPAFGSDRTMAMGPPPPGANFAPPPPAGGPGIPPPVAKGAPPLPTPFPGAKLPKDEDEQTMVAQPSADLINAASGANPALDPAAEWPQVYEEFIRTKRECGEPVDGLTFEKFQQTLKKNRDALIQRHGCKRVKFSVYVKEGRASLKATPVRD
ncbi:MAG: alpha 1 type collagen [Labilithrix sp.]|nr:alpha 1 type collagen [Labilithrix sp.]